MKQQEPLSSAEQAALFAPASHLRLLSLGLGDAGILGIASPRTEGGTIQTQPFSSDIAKWALPYAERIRVGGDLFRAGRVQEALKEFLSIDRDLPNAAIVLMNIGVCHSELGDKAAARSWLEKSQQLVPPDLAYQVRRNLSGLDQAGT
jgi:tetratricopeptide (TPR) repeat protein